LLMVQSDSCGNKSLMTSHRLCTDTIPLACFCSAYVSCVLAVLPADSRKLLCSPAHAEKITRHRSRLGSVHKCGKVTWKCLCVVVVRFLHVSVESSQDFSHRHSKLARRKSIVYCSDLVIALGFSAVCGHFCLRWLRCKQ